MPDAGSMVYPVERSEASATLGLLAEELDFYTMYAWCLDPHLTAQQALDHLRHEIAILRETGEGWQTEEVATNVYLLACALLNVLEEAIRGKALRMPRHLASRRIGLTARHIANYVLQPRTSRPTLRAIRWKEDLQAGLQQYLPAVICGRAKDRSNVARSLAGLEAVVQTKLPLGIGAKHIGVPSPFRRPHSPGRSRAGQAVRHAIPRPLTAGLAAGLAHLRLLLRSLAARIPRCRRPYLHRRGHDPARQGGGAAGAPDARFVCASWIYGPGPR